MRDFGCASIIRHMHGDYKSGFSKHIRECSALRIELWDIYVGLSITKSLGFHKVELNIDSSTIVRMLETSKVLAIDGVSMVYQILLLIEMHDEVKVTHLYRKTNKCANVLAKIVAESGEGKEFGDQFPNFIKNFCCM